MAGAGVRFTDARFGLSPSTLEAVESMGFTFLTPVQAATIPLFMGHKDVLVEATTGSGKTLAFLIPLLEILERREEKWENDETGAVILSPTRELARQIFGVLQAFCKFFTSYKPLLLVGGGDVMKDLKDLNGEKAKIIVGSPGRVLDIIKRTEEGTQTNSQKRRLLRSVEVLVLDEADTLLGLGFEQDINEIISRLPKQRRTGLFSATQTEEVRSLARAGLRNPAVVKVNVKGRGVGGIASNGSKDAGQAVPSSLKNYFVMVEPENKLGLLQEFLSSHSQEKTIVFFSTCACVDYFYGIFSRYMDKIPVVSLHGRQTQTKRQKNLETFKELDGGGVLFCTDVAARGLDLPDVSWIVQLDTPQEPEFFIHRIGRTARAGRAGNAMVFLLANEEPYINFLRMKKVPIEEMKMECADPKKILNEARSYVVEDRDMLVKGTRAFISYIRSYREHKCSFIFRLEELDVGAVARGFSLLQLPKITELRSMKVDFTPPPDIDVSAIRFKDKNREKQRKEKEERIALEMKTKREEMQDKKRIREQQKESKLRQADARRRKKSKHFAIVEEWDELAEEERLHKKYKKGLISKEEYEEAIRRNDAGLVAADEEIGNLQHSASDTDGSDSDEDGRSEAGSVRKLQSKESGLGNITGKSYVRKQIVTEVLPGRLSKKKFIEEKQRRKKNFLAKRRGQANKNRNRSR